MTRPKKATDVRSRSDEVRDAIVEDLKAAGEPLPLAKMASARATARNARELYIVAERLRTTGRIIRHGKGYHQGEPHRYELPLSPF